MPRLQHMERERVTKWPSMRSEKFSAEGRRISGEKFSFVAVEFKEVVGRAGFNVCLDSLSRCSGRLGRRIW